MDLSKGSPKMKERTGVCYSIEYLIVVFVSVCNYRNIYKR